MRMRVGSTDGKGASSFTGTFESAVSLLCGSIRSRFSHVAAAHRQKKVQCVSGMFVGGVVGAYLSMYGALTVPPTTRTIQHSTPTAS